MDPTGSSWSTSLTDSLQFAPPPSPATTLSVTHSGLRCVPPGIATGGVVEGGRRVRPTVPVPDTSHQSPTTVSVRHWERVTVSSAPRHSSVRPGIGGGGVDAGRTSLSWTTGGGCRELPES